MKDHLAKFEEDNFDWLIDEFLKTKEAALLWADFVYNKYVGSMREPDDMEDR
jgi:hypothetical protein